MATQACNQVSKQSFSASHAKTLEIARQTVVRKRADEDEMLSVTQPDGSEERATQRRRQLERPRALRLRLRLDAQTPI